MGREAELSQRTARLIAAFGSWIVRLLIFTLRIRIQDGARVLNAPSTPPLIWAFWHNSLFVIPHLYEHYLSHRPGCALTSASKDGEILAAFLERFHIRPIRGSSSRQGVAALLEMRRLIADGYDMAITPDGPRGPRYRLNPGIITLAQKTEAPVMPIRVRYSRCWRLQTWDQFEIPFPFARVEIVLLPLLRIAATSTEEEFERKRVQLEDLLRGDPWPIDASD